MGGPALFNTVPQEDYLSLFPAGRTNYKKVVRLLDFKKKEVATASNIPVHSIRYDQKIPKELANLIQEWAILLSMVARYFQNPHKTVLWFKIPNPLLGNVTPREMVRVGRFDKLRRFIQN